MIFVAVGNFISRTREDRTALDCRGMAAPPAKVFIGSIPLNLPEDIVRSEFAKYGTITHFYLKQDASGPQRSWCFCTYSCREEGQAAIDATQGGQLVLPGAAGPCEVSWARAAQQGSTSLQVMPGTNINMPPPMPGTQPPPAQNVGTSQLVSGPTKLFVGSIPVGITKEQINQEFSKYGSVAEVFMKNDQSDPDRLWGFVTYSTGEAAALAVSMLNETMAFPNGTRPLSVSYARTSGGAAPPAAAPGLIVPGMVGGGAPAVSVGPVKLFVGSIPGGTTHEMLKAEFAKSGNCTDVFLKNDVNDPGRMWGFVTMGNGTEAAAAVAALNERLVLPGGLRPCNVSYARSSNNSSQVANQALMGAAVATSNKLFLGSIPIGTTEADLRREFERFGAVTDIFLKNDSSDSTRMWGFLNYSDPTAAAMAVSTLADKLMLPGSTRPVAVSFARSGGTTSTGGVATMPGDHGWRVYYNAEGFPYYHHAATNRTVWECPPELTAQAAASSGGLLSPLGAGGLAGTTLLGAAAAPVDALPEGWNSASDATSGKTYYYNGTGQVQWERPLDVNKLIGASSASGFSATGMAGGMERSAPY